MVTIRALVPADHDDWLPLWQAYLSFYQTELTASQTALTFYRLTDPGFPLHGAIARRDDGAAAGIVHWLPHPNTWRAGDYCYLEDLFVAPQERGAGTGRALIGHVVDWARGAGCAKVHWLTSATNATARGLYDGVAADTGMVQYAVTL
ncbi:MAG: GNAT family N-acetyltransferase [Propionicimonas sp.]|nr:GNAT family N-acetyltransferase [Propionicimonas sp.]